MEPEKPRKSMFMIWVVCLVATPAVGWLMWTDDHGGWKALPVVWLLYLWFLIRDTREYRRLMREYLEHQGTQSPEEESAP
ncbi:hypothetical protein KIK06_22570 [Nocardiopsis sp. EMB25]|uniref:hypothetical protein n=1 Tax=Nocardiopsis sp. EMB25 TaxID=2835867 RepID=UPI002284D43A|nr:hypothetical protein [Nocardiopsis sp. EMB25]MCY9786674.1 hypothetical protein [Nocardiopsis sp. EMB25]